MMEASNNPSGDEPVSQLLSQYPQLEALSADDKCRLAEELREAAFSDPAYVPAWHKRIIQERLKAHRKNPDDVIPVSEAVEGVRAELKAIHANDD